MHRFFNYVRFHLQRDSAAHKLYCSGMPTLLEFKTPPDLAVKILSNLNVNAAYCQRFDYYFNTLF